MRMDNMLVKSTVTAACLLILMAGIYIFTYFFPDSDDFKRPDVSVGPGVVEGKGTVELPAEGDVTFPGESDQINHYFSILEESEDSLDRQSAAFRLSYLATSDGEELLLRFLTDSDEVVAKRCAEALLRIWQKSDSHRATRFLNRALEAWQSGDAQKTKMRLEESTRLDPAVPDMYRLLAEALMKLGDIPQAKRAARKALDLKPEHFAAYYILARCRLMLGDEEIAMQHIDRALELYPTYSEAREVKEELTQ